MNPCAVSSDEKKLDKIKSDCSPLIFDHVKDTHILLAYTIFIAHARNQNFELFDVDKE